MGHIPSQRKLSKTEVIKKIYEEEKDGQVFSFQGKYCKYQIVKLLKLEVFHRNFELEDLNLKKESQSFFLANTNCKDIRISKFH